MVLDLLAEAMIKAIDEKCEGYLLDAFPINLEQAKAFEEFIGSPTKIIYLSLAQATFMTFIFLYLSDFDQGYHG